jgi:transcriptional repressor NrdR
VRCPFCKADDDRVIDSRASNDGFAIRRRRECLGCERRFTTYERIEESPLRVVKKDERREPFERRKILLGMIKASEKRPIPISALEAATELIENAVLEKFDTEVPTVFVGQLVMEALKRIDQVAYVRFASVYREFEDVTEFADALKQLDDAPEQDEGQKAQKSRSKKAKRPASKTAGEKDGAGAPKRVTQKKSVEGPASSSRSKKRS